MKRNVFTLSAALLILSGMYACKKGSDAASSNTTQALFSGAWKLHTYELMDKNYNFTQFPIPSSDAGEAFVFKPDGTFTLTSAGYQQGSGNWSMYDNGKTLDLGLIGDFHIDLLNSSTLQLSDSTEDAFKYEVNGTYQTFYGERDTFSH
jgi:hypothetical protein